MSIPTFWGISFSRREKLLKLGFSGASHIGNRIYYCK